MRPVHRAIPDLGSLLELVREQHTHPGSTLHGEQHWQAVARAGLRLVQGGVPCDPAVVLGFALLHDHRRLTDGIDPLHGPRAAENLPVFAAHLDLHEAQWELLARACRDHTAVVHTDDPTIGACFDADRLNLMRVHIAPDPAYLNHPQSRDEELIAECSRVVLEPVAWDELLAGYVAAARAAR